MISFARHIVQDTYCPSASIAEAREFDLDFTVTLYNHLLYISKIRNISKHAMSPPRDPA